MSIQAVQAGRQDFTREAPAQIKTDLKTAPQQEAQQQERERPHHAIERAAAELERVSLAFNRRLQFVVDHESHEVSVKVIDKETDRVIRTLPPEEMRRMHERIREAIGLLFDEKV
ncbi:MAG: flagellar protein FlaG [Treponema sp.]|jgi:flagellar protein FlaG|nr:flagellar protein FlaG [Treponema sp.]